MRDTVQLHLYEVPRKVKFRDTRQNSGCQGLEAGGKGDEKLVVLIAYRVSVL